MLSRRWHTQIGLEPASQWSLHTPFMTSRLWPLVLQVLWCHNQQLQIQSNFLDTVFLLKQAEKSLWFLLVVFQTEMLSIKVLPPISKNLFDAAEWSYTTAASHVTDDSHMSFEDNTRRMRKQPVVKPQSWAASELCSFTHTAQFFHLQWSWKSWHRARFGLVSTINMPVCRLKQNQNDNPVILITHQSTLVAQISKCCV